MQMPPPQPISQMERSVSFLQEVGMLQWKARNEPAMWELLRRAAAAAAEATSVGPGNEAMINQLAEDIIRRADSDLTVFKLLQHAAAAAKSEAGSTIGDDQLPEPANLPPAQQIISAGDMEQALAEALGVADTTPVSEPFPQHIAADAVSVVSCDTEGPMPIIPIRTDQAKQTRRTPEVAPGIGDIPVVSHIEEVGVLSQVPNDSEAFAERLKMVLDRYRAGVQGKQKERESDQNEKLDLLKAAFDAGALSSSAFADAVAALSRPAPPPVAAAPVPVPVAVPITTPLPTEAVRKPVPTLLSPLPLPAEAPIDAAVVHPIQPNQPMEAAAAAPQPEPAAQHQTRLPVRMMSPMRPARTPGDGTSPRPTPRPCRDMSPSNRASQRSHSTRVMNARKHKAACLTPVDPGQGEWSPVGDEL